MTETQLSEQAKAWTDEELFDFLREEVNSSRNYGHHNGPKLRAVVREMQNRGWKISPPSMTGYE